jgi:hypothetical protein
MRIYAAICFAMAAIIFGMILGIAPFCATPFRATPGAATIFAAALRLPQLVNH